MTAQSQWTHVLTQAEIDARFDLTHAVDPRFAREQRRFYATRTSNELKALINQAWLCNDADGYQMARSYLALMNGVDVDVLAA
jgi:hypothetical protein